MQKILSKNEYVLWHIDKMTNFLPGIFVCIYGFLIICPETKNAHKMRITAENRNFAKKKTKIPVYFRKVKRNRDFGSLYLK